MWQGDVAHVFLMVVLRNSLTSYYKKCMTPPQIIDNLPAASIVTEEGTVETSYSKGFPVGYKASGERRGREIDWEGGEGATSHTNLGRETF
jgi:hypothetical protein